jgi:ATP-dependent RNA helicase DDX3X
MSGWGTQDLAAALPKVQEETQVEAAKNPREHGWVEKTSYDYETYNKTGKELKDEAAASAPVEVDESHVMGVDRGAWASSAAIYEWNEEYGDVGPAFLALEEQLFRGEDRMRAGVNFEM